MGDRGIAEYQLRELAKQLTLLEGHLRNFQPQAGEQICCHCSEKHAFNIEALAEESLNILPDLAPTLRRLAEWARKNQAFFQACEMDEADANRLLEECRGFRKPIMDPMQAKRGRNGGGLVPQVEDAILHAHGYNPGLLHGEDELLIHAIPDAMGMGAIVLDREKAMAHPCLRIRADGAELVFAKGAVGALTPEEQKELCGKGYVEPSAASQEHYAKRLETFKAASRHCREAVRSLGVPRARVEAYVECMRAQLSGKEYLPHAPVEVAPEAPAAPGTAEGPGGAPETARRAPRRGRVVREVSKEAEERRKELETLASMTKHARILERYNTNQGSRLATVQVENGKVKLRIRGTKDGKVMNEWGDPYPVEERDIDKIRAKAVEKFLVGTEVVPVS
jgi:hypothetical protein